jgi:hypothetical protein
LSKLRDGRAGRCEPGIEVRMRMKAAQRKGGSHRWELTRLRAWCALHPGCGGCAQPGWRSLASTTVSKSSSRQLRDGHQCDAKATLRVPLREASGGGFCLLSRSICVCDTESYSRAARVLREVAPTPDRGRKRLDCVTGACAHALHRLFSLAHDRSHQFARPHPCLSLIHILTLPTILLV